MQSHQFARSFCLEVALESWHCIVIENTAAKYLIPLLTVVFRFPVLMLAMEEPTASGVFCNRMLSMVNSEDVNAIIQAQRHM